MAPVSSLSLLRDSAVAALIAGLLAVPLLGVRLVDSANGLSLDGRPELVGAAVALVFCGRLLFGLTRRWLSDFSLGLPTLRRPPHQIRFAAGWAMVLFALVLPLLPFADRTLIDRATLVLIYVMLGWGLNITVGLAGLLDLGFVAFYAVGAYAYALLSQAFGLSFWACLPLAGMIAAAFGLGLGFPVLRLRGDYLAIVTMGFGESMRIVLQNWQSLTNGPIGISGIERPTLFGLQFKAFAKPGETTFADFFHIPFSPDHRVIFLYFMILLLALATNLFTLRIRRLPVGRAWEALREDEIACRSLGLNPTTIKLSAFALGAMFAGFAGSFFAARQGFVSPESFTFLESAMIVAIVVLGGMGSQIGIVLAALLLVALPEWIRDLEQYRMLIFGITMVVIMLWRPSGLLSARSPTIRLGGTP
ncbi:high-affinity branched-chain amino acid ABC transporter permease LivM [Phaeospirillum tilakii]|uniref:High-affinity branched-chain amino acid ABC transporter permease LivM n=1 Tax=Phaeospirillum tilakii TaxID=741673 RepID=A0ABW5CAW7_9PROT